VLHPEDCVFVKALVGVEVGVGVAQYFHKLSQSCFVACACLPSGPTQFINGEVLIFGEGIGVLVGEGVNVGLGVDEIVGEGVGVVVILACCLVWNVYHPTPITLAITKIIIKGRAAKPRIKFIIRSLSLTYQVLNMIN
jgi:hypothetical protein